jgi:hypothetical protein
MKIVRKYWVGKVHYTVYSQMQHFIFRLFQVDIEEIQEYAINDLRKFYLEELNMSFNDLYLHIPQLKNTDYLQQKDYSRTVYQLDKNAIERRRAKFHEENCHKSSSMSINGKSSTEEGRS